MQTKRRSRPRLRPWLLIVLAIASTSVLVFSSIWVVNHYDRKFANKDGGNSALQPESVSEPHTSLPQSSTTTAASPAPQARLTAEFEELAASINGTVGFAAAPVADQTAVISLGEWQSGPAWSTSKIPLVLAALRDGSNPQLTPQMELAITHSDNGAAEQVWSSLGEPDIAAIKVGNVLHEVGDPTVVESQRIRPGFTAFGQTIWSLTNQARFLAGIACDPHSTQVLDLMGEVESDQAWGMGRLSNARFKGGWGPSTSGAYLVRQFGLIQAPGGTVAVALAVEPSSGSFDDGIRALNTMTTWISDHLGELPAGKCH